MPRFFVEKEILPDATAIELDADDSHHILHVLRLQPGEIIEVCDDRHTLFHCVLPPQPSAGWPLVVDIRERQPARSELPFEVILYQGLPKGDKFSDIVRVCVELGVFRMVPVICARSIARPVAGKAAARTARWNQVAKAAAKQCGRSLLPEVEAPVNFAQALEDFSAVRTEQTLSFVPYEAEDAVSLRRLLEDSQAVQRPERICFFIGPEGGFAAAEMAAFRSLGCHTVTLGPRILRTETAGGAVLAMLGYRFEQDWSII
jgi:16S rRNA (uracil1498-N3)-methyltransferase